jgi:uncharacterized protein (DUF433 family)
MTLERITFNNKIMGGQACIRGLRVPVSLIVNMIANGASFADIQDAYDYIEEEDIRQALQFAAWTVSDHVMAI